MICIFVVTKRVKTDMKIFQCNAKPKDVIIPFLHPPILCGNYTPQFCKMTKKILTIIWLHATDSFQYSSSTLSNFP